MRSLFFTFFLLAGSLTLSAQTALTWEQTLDLLSETEDMENVGWASTGALLGDLFVQKIDINTATREDLEQLPFLSAQQIEEICEYVYKYAPLRSLSELSMIESLDAASRLLLQQFLRIDVQEIASKPLPSLPTLMKHGKNELVAYTQVPFYSREGDREGYLGYKYRHWLRYAFTRGSWVKAGIVTSQDAGEPFFANRNGKGYDYYSFYLLLRKLGPIKTLAAGRYRMKLGMGLVMNTSMGFGKLATLVSLGPSASVISAHSSRSEANYLQGVATTVNLTSDLDLTTFASYRYRDATLDDEGNATTLLTSGYHRTQSEIDRKHNTRQTLFGGHIAYRIGAFKLGMTATHASLNRRLEPDTRQDYRRFYPTGSKFWNASIDYAFRHRQLSISGETATGG